MPWYQKVTNFFRRQPKNSKSSSNQAPAGVYVTNDLALTHTAVWCAIKLLSETMGVLPFKVFDRLPNGNKDEVFTGRINEMLTQKPNPLTTIQTFKETITAHVAGWGNGYAEIERDNLGRAVNLWIITPNRVRPFFDDFNDLWYEVRNDSYETVNIPAANMIHVHGFGFDGVMGYDPISYNAQAISQGLAMENHTSAFFKNGAYAAGGLFAKAKLDEDARGRIRDAWEETYRGSDKAYRMAVFGEDMEYKQFSMSPEASQLLESRKYKVSDIARIFRVPNHLLGDLDKATFSNIESQGIEFVTYTILPWAVRWEQEIKLKLLTREANRFAKLNLNMLMRGDTKSRFEAYKIGREWGWLNANEIRALEDMDAIPGQAGAAYIVPMNYQLAKDIGKPKEPTPAPALPAPDPDNETGEEETEAFKNVANDIAKRIARKNINQVSNKSGTDFDKYIHENFNAWTWEAEQLEVLAKIVNNENIDFSAEVCAEVVKQEIKTLFLSGETSHEQTEQAVKEAILRNITGA